MWLGCARSEAAGAQKHPGHPVPRAHFPLQTAAPHGVAFTGRTAAAAEKEAEGRIRSRCPQRKKHPDRLLGMEEQR